MGSAPDGAGVVVSDEGERARRWAATMRGHGSGAYRSAHADGPREVGESQPFDRERREELQREQLAAGATLAAGAGRRQVPEDPDPLRTCFERDRDRILHSSAFRRLAGKTQVFVFPEDHQRTRLTHALEVAQVATAVARATGLNDALTEAIALGHDCGHGPGGHASEDALSPYVTGGFDHALWGADVTLAALNLCEETLDGVRNHSWSRPAPSTPEGDVVSWADRIAYVAHDLEDAVHAGIVTPSMLPSVIVERCGATRREQLRTFITALIEGISDTGRVVMDASVAEALGELRAFNYERIYVRDESRVQWEAVIAVLRALVEHFTAHPESIAADDLREDLEPASERAVQAAVAYVAGMTDRFAFRTAVTELGWDVTALPLGIDTGNLL